MTELKQAAQQALEALIENSRLLGSTQAKKRFGSYSLEDARFERVCNKFIAKYKASIIAALEQPEQRKPLTASEILNIMPSSIPAEHDGALMEFARAIEDKLKEGT